MPIAKGGPDDQKLVDVADKLAYELKNPEYSGTLGYNINAKVDRDTQHSPGWKFHEYELIGIPIRVELGLRDLEKNQVTIVRRDTGVKQFIPIADAAKTIARELGQMQNDLLERAREARKKYSFVVDDYEDFKKKLDEPGGFLHCHWCEKATCEEQIKNETKATIRCIPLDASDRLTPAVEQGRCIKCGDKSMSRVIFARSY
ncbi:MAG: hypothetical protein HY074_20425 [Deltaproteobacteria bacterium]|nr:hypothetical protein [Deltaproteobacteria bacterium]